MKTTNSMADCSNYPIYLIPHKIASILSQQIKFSGGCGWILGIAQKNGDLLIEKFFYKDQQSIWVWKEFQTSWIPTIPTVSNQLNNTEKPLHSFFNFSKKRERK